MDTILLKETFQRIGQENGGSTAFGLRFYQRLFEQYPQVRPLFKTPPEEQHKKLLTSLGVVVSHVNRLEEVVPYLHAMGIRHLAYGTETGHYGAVGENLLAVMQAHLSKEGEWTPEMNDTWTEAVNTVAHVMIEAADHPENYLSEMTQAGYEPDGFRKPADPRPVYAFA
jgi:methyl-accepting chemotaxis protein